MAAARWRGDLLLTGGSAAGYAHLDGPDVSEDGDMRGELVVHPAYRRRGYGSALISAVVAGADGHGIRLWAHGDLPAAAALARSAGFTRFRALWQLHMPLIGRALPAPAWPAGVSVRTFRPGEDEDEWLAVNGRAFAHHPEQGSWTRKDLEVREAEPWFDPAGFFIAERDGRMAALTGEGAPVGRRWRRAHRRGLRGGRRSRPARRRPWPRAHARWSGTPAASRPHPGDALRRRVEHGGHQDVHRAGLRPVAHRRDVPAIRALAARSAARWIDAKHGVKFRGRKRSVARGDGTEHFGVEFDLV